MPRYDSTSKSGPYLAVNGIEISPGPDALCVTLTPAKPLHSVPPWETLDRLLTFPIEGMCLAELVVQWRVQSKTVPFRRSLAQSGPAKAFWPSLKGARAVNGQYLAHCGNG